MKFLTSLFAGFGLASLCSAHGKLFVASKSGNITTLDVVHGFHGTSLAVISSQSGCGATPIWLELDRKTSTLYCTNEGANEGNASISSFSAKDDGSLTLKSVLATPFGGVSSTVYGGGTTLAIAHFNNFITTVSLSDPNKLQLITSTNITSNITTPAKPHQVLLDPFGKYIFVPAFGTDQVHWFSINAENHNLTYTNHVTLPKGSNPRHGVFYLPPGGDKLIAYYYVVTETSNKVHGLEIKYDTNHAILNATQIFETSTFSDVIPGPIYAAEISISPDNKSLIISSRNDTQATFTYPTTNSSLALPASKSDTLISYPISPVDGKLQNLTRSPAGGSWPRHFSFNAAGDIVAVALEKEHKVVLIKRNVATGILEDKILSEIVIDGEVTCVVWDEDDEGGHEPGPVVVGGPVQNGTYIWSSSASKSLSMPTTLLTSVVAGLTTAMTAGVMSTVTVSPLPLSVPSATLVGVPSTTAVGSAASSMPPTTAVSNAAGKVDYKTMKTVVDGVTYDGGRDEY